MGYEIWMMENIYKDAGTKMRDWCSFLEGA
jgi:hypothetical protein